MLPIREYSHLALEDDINQLIEKHPSLEGVIIGRSVCSRPLYALAIGNKAAKKRVFWSAGFHGMEWMTSWVLMNYISDLCERNDKLLRECRLFFVPMVNPDGIEIALTGTRWQANANGVDINHNFPARWQQIMAKPHWTRYGGKTPASEPETRALMTLTKRGNFSRVFALHSQGEEIYWDFNNIHIEGARELAEKMAEVSGYTVATPEPIASFGGYKDWFIQEFRRPGYTIELGKGNNPLPMENFQHIYKKALAMFEIACYS